MRRTRWPLAALISLISVGCGSNTAPQTDAGSTKKATDQATLVKFAECIRGHGVPHFPDANAKGEFVFGIDVTQAVWAKAVDACKDLQPPGTLSAKRTPEEQTAGLRFAQCVRENGVKDFPDPVNGEPLIDTTKIPSSNQPGGMTILNAATHKCGDLLGKAAAGQ
jgi:hypothetical protein